MAEALSLQPWCGILPFKPRWKVLSIYSTISAGWQYPSLRAVSIAPSRVSTWLHSTRAPEKAFQLGEKAFGLTKNLGGRGQQGRIPGHREQSSNPVADNIMSAG